MALSIELTPRAQRMLDDADARWTTEHGDDNPLLDEIARAADLLREMPELRPQPDRSRIVIVAIWYARRGSGPPL